MADRVKLEVERRSETGKGAARTLRREGYVPAVVYGHGQESQPCKVPSKELEKLLTSISYENTLIDLKVGGGRSRPVLIREVQVHPFKPEVLHVDFLVVRKGEKLRVEVPIRLVGLAPGVKEGGIMEHLLREVEVRCDPDAIPESLELDVSALEVGDSLTVGDLPVPAGVEVMEEATSAVCAVVPPTKVEEVVAPEAEELEALEAEEGVEAGGEAEEAAGEEEEGGEEPPSKGERKS